MEPQRRRKSDYRSAKKNTQVYYCADCADRYRWPKDQPISHTGEECTVCGDNDDVVMYAAEWNADQGMVVHKAEEAKKPGTTSIRERVQRRVEHDGRTFG